MTKNTKKENKILLKGKKRNEDELPDFFEEVEEDLAHIHEKELKTKLEKIEAKKNFKPKKTPILEIVEGGVVSSKMLQDKLKLSDNKAEKILSDLCRLDFVMHDNDQYFITDPEGVKGYFYGTKDDEIELVNQIEALTSKLKGIGHDRLSLISDEKLEKLLDLKFEIEEDFISPNYMIPLNDYYGAISSFLDCGLDCLPHATLVRVFFAYAGFDYDIAGIDKTCPDTIIDSLVMLGCLKRLSDGNYKVEKKREFLKILRTMSKTIGQEKLKEYATAYVDNFIVECLMYDKKFVKKMWGNLGEGFSYRDKVNSFASARQKDPQQTMFTIAGLERMAELLGVETATQISNNEKGSTKSSRATKNNKKLDPYAQAYETMFFDIDSGHISISALERIFNLEYEDAEKTMDVLIEKGLVKRMEKSYKIVSKARLKKWFKDEFVIEN